MMNKKRNRDRLKAREYQSDEDESVIFNYKENIEYVKLLQTMMNPDLDAIRTCFHNFFYTSSVTSSINRDMILVERNKQEIVIVMLFCGKRGFTGILTSTLAYYIIRKTIGGYKCFKPRKILRELITQLSALPLQETDSISQDNSLYITISVVDPGAGLMTFSGNGSAIIHSSGEIVLYQGKTNQSKQMNWTVIRYLLKKKLICRLRIPFIFLTKDKHASP